MGNPGLGDAVGSCCWAEPQLPSSPSAPLPVLGESPALFTRSKGPWRAALDAELVISALLPS